MSRIFLDTNFLLYTIDERDPVRMGNAMAALESLPSSGHTAVISTQVMQEFYSAAVRKLGLSPADAYAELELLGHLEVTVIEPSLVLRAAEWSDHHQLSFWDALILATAAATGCQEVWTEDMNAGQTVGTVTIINPFRP